MSDFLKQKKYLKMVSFATTNDRQTTSYMVTLTNYFWLYKINAFQTRKHSSRMRTACISSHLGGRGVSAWGVYTWAYLHRGCLPGGVCPGGCLPKGMYIASVNRRTHMCKILPCPKLLLGEVITTCCWTFL